MADTPNFPPTPKWQPDFPIDIELIYKTTQYYTGGKLQFAIFENGTVVFFSQPVTNIADSAIEILNKVYYAHPDFKPVTMNDGNYIVQYSQSAFSIVFKHELEKYWHKIDENHMDALCKDEVLIDGQGRKNTFDRIGKICLFGRTKMFMDAQSPEVVMTSSDDNLTP